MVLVRQMVYEVAGIDEMRAIDEADEVREIGADLRGAGGGGDFLWVPGGVGGERIPLCSSDKSLAGSWGTGGNNLELVLTFGLRVRMQAVAEKAVGLVYRIAFCNCPFAKGRLFSSELFQS